MWAVLAAAESGGVRNVEAYAGGVCHNLIAAAIGQRMSRRRMDPVEELRDSKPGPESSIASRDRKRTIQRALGGLSPFKRALIVGHYLGDESKEAICKSLGITEQQFWDYKKAALRQCRERVSGFTKRRPPRGTATRGA